MNNVDVVGIEGVSKFISSSKLTKFIIFRQGARSGATPVYDGSHCNNVNGVVNSFRDWASNILAANPGNNNPYEMLLFDKKIDAEDMDDDFEAEATGNKKPKSKLKKIRFSFCLANFNPYGGNQGGHINVAEAVKQALAERDQQDTLKAVLIKLNALEAQMNGDNDEEEDEPKESMMDKAFKLIKEVNIHEKLKKGVHVAGDEDEEEEEEEEVVTKTQTGDVQKELAKIKTALKTLRKHTNDLGEMMMCLAKFAEKNPTMFKQYMNTLKNSV